MSEFLNIAGVELERVEVEGVTYTYPADRMPHEHLALATDLSSAHADGDDIVMLETDPEAYPAQGAYFLASEPRDHEFVTNMGNQVDSRFENMLDRMLEDKQQVKMLDRIAEHLESGGNIVNAVPHGSLLDIGVMHGLAYAALARNEVTFRSGIDISHGITGLGREFGGHKVALATALSWACHKIWFVTPRTENAARSEYSQVVPNSQIDQQNRVARADIAAEQDTGGMLITAALSATSYKLVGDARQLMAPTLGTLKMFVHPRTQLSVTVGEIQSAQQPIYEFNSRLWQLSEDEPVLKAQGDEILETMTADLNATVADSRFVYEGSGS
jgi:hypothetical protein